jgi:hypothetical protein
MQVHTLFVRRNVIVTDEVIGENSIVIEQANNRTYAAQLVAKILKWAIKKIRYRNKLGNIIDDSKELKQFF